MNFLAHAFLSGSNDFKIIGNFIGDFVKGNTHKTYPKRIQEGILLHRAIDNFTDNSAITKESKLIFSPLYGKYAGIIVDIVYDHFLSVHWNSYSNTSREYFIAHVYNILSQYYYILPQRAQQLIPSIIYHNWMRYYASFYGLEKVLQRMEVRTSLPKQSHTCIEILRENYSELNAQFEGFFKEIQKEFRFYLENKAARI